MHSTELKNVVVIWSSQDVQIIDGMVVTSYLINGETPQYVSLYAAKHGSDLLCTENLYADGFSGYWIVYFFFMF